MSAGFAYIGRDAAGIVQAAVADSQDKETANCVAEWILNGLTIERVPSAWVRKNFHTDTPYVPEVQP